MQEANGAYVTLMRRAQGLIRDKRLDPTQVGLLEADLQDANRRKREIGEAILRELGLDVDHMDFSIDEETGEVYQIG